MDLPTDPTLLGVLALSGVLLATLGYVVGRASRKRQRLAAEATAARLIELDHLRDRYVAITSHEIRGPLTTIIAGIDTLRRHPEKLNDESRDRLLNMVAQQGRQLSRLVDDLMISSEVEAGQLVVEPEMTDLDEAVQRALEAAGTRRRSHQLEVFVEPLRCEIDGFRVSQMLRNLIENAYKYTPDRTNVKVSGRATEDGIELEVVDDGPGIPEEKRGILFEAFSRLRETAAGTEGVGLGLYVVSQLTAAMDARLDVASSSRGTTFTIRIPCRVEPIAQLRMGIISSEEGSGA